MARAKFNVRLEVGGKGPDGYHAIRSVIADLAVADVIDFSAASTFSIECDDRAITGEANLSYAAARNLAIDLPSARVFIKKVLPQQSGLGGGSADAAATLRGIARILAEMGRPIADEALLAAAIETGSDVPACLFPGLKSIEGRGEKVRPLGFAPPPWGVLLLKPAVGVDTKSGYRVLDESRVTATEDIESGDGMMRLIVALRKHDFDATCALAHNDFQAPIESAYPQIAAARRRVEDTGAPATSLCGSGSCVAGFFPSVEDAREAAARLSLLDGEWSCATGFTT